MKTHHIPLLAAAIGVCLASAAHATMPAAAPEAKQDQHQQFAKKGSSKKPKPHAPKKGGAA